MKRLRRFGDAGARWRPQELLVPAKVKTWQSLRALPPPFIPPSLTPSLLSISTLQNTHTHTHTDSPLEHLFRQLSGSSTSELMILRAAEKQKKTKTSGVLRKDENGPKLGHGGGGADRRASRPRPNFSKDNFSTSST